MAHALAVLYSMGIQLSAPHSMLLQLNVSRLHDYLEAPVCNPNSFWSMISIQVFHKPLYSLISFTNADIASLVPLMFLGVSLYVIPHQRCLNHIAPL